TAATACTYSSHVLHRPSTYYAQPVATVQHLLPRFYRSLFFFFYCYGDHRDLHSFPTRRSSDLLSGSPLASTGHNQPEREKASCRSEERFSRNAETDIVCRLLLEKKTLKKTGWER